MKTKKFAMQLTAAVAASALILTGCSSADSGDTKAKDSETSTTDIKDEDINAKDRDEIKDGGTFTTALAEISEQQNRFHADSTYYTTRLWRWYNPQLVYFDANGEAHPNKDFITDWKSEFKDGKTIVTYDINEKATFNDGTPIDWRAFETTWKISNGKDEAYSPDSTDGYELIESVTPGKSDKQVIVTYESPWPWWQGLFNSIAHPALADPANYNSYIKQLHPEWGAGPFTVESADFNKGEVVFKRNDKWWGNPGKLDQRIFRQMESKAEVNAFKNGEIDAAGAGTREDYAAVKDMSGVSIRMSARTRTNLLTLNASSEILSDPKVREALVAGYDREITAKILTNGIPYDETPPGSLTLYPFQPDYQDNFSKAVKVGADNAKKLLDEAGWVEGADGIREKDGKKLSLRYALFGNSETFKSQATAVQKFYRDIGVDIQIDSRPSSEFSKTTNSGDFDLLPMAFKSTDPYGVAYFGQMFNSDSQLNKSHTGTPELDAKIKELQKLGTAEEQTKRANELEVEALQQFGIFPTFNGADIFAVKEGVANYGATAFGVHPVENIGWVK